MEERLNPVPDAVLRRPDGWLDAHDLSRHVRQSLENTVGAVLPDGEGSFDVQHWTDVDAAGRRVHLAAGLWRSRIVATPAARLDCLVDLGVGDAAAYAERAIAVRFDWKRAAGIARPGQVILRTEASARPTGGTARLVLPPPEIRCLAGDFRRKVREE